MKYVKTLGLAAVAAAALMAILGVSTASATTLEDNLGKLKAGSIIKAHLESGTKSKLTTGYKTIECSESEITMATTNETGAEVTSSVELTFGNCNCEVKVLSGGFLSVAWNTGTSNGNLTWSGTEVTTTCTVLSIPIHCIYVTKSSPVGVLTGSKSTGATATMDINEANIPREPTHASCVEKAKWDANYLVENPDTLNVIN